MCGIFGYVGQAHSEGQLKPFFDRIQHRGPDKSRWAKVKDDMYFGFHRLAINGLNPKSDQPFHLRGCWLIANAEIFNHKELTHKHQLPVVSESDCEVIIHLYKSYGIEKTLHLLDGEFAFLLYDEERDITFAARDHLGIRGMYVGESHGGRVKAWASESKALTFLDTLAQFPTGCFWSSEAPDRYQRYYHLDFAVEDRQDERYYLEGIRHYLDRAVQKRLMSDRPVGCLLSGGLDSSLVAALAAKHYEKGKMETFSIGLKGSPDLYHAQKVADQIGTKHHSVEVDEKDFLAALEDTVYTLGSFDVTTVRASVGHRLISHYVRDHSDVKVLFSGETADEFGSYLYFQNAPTTQAFQDEAIRLLSDIHFFDMKRGDRSISSAGLEARVPFADKDFMKFYMSIHPRHRMFDETRMEKYLIRKAFDSEGILPKEVLWRRKNGFSDSVSSKNRSWSEIIKDHVETLVSDGEFANEAAQFQHDTPQYKEAYYYRKIFTQTYGKHQNLTPYQWLPRWCGDIKDPSARKLTKLYAAD